MITLAELWEDLERLLRRAQRQLPPPYNEEPFRVEIQQALATTRLFPSSTLTASGPVGEALLPFERFLWFTEYALAWDALVAIALAEQASDECWYTLTSAAHLMELGEDDTAFPEVLARIRRG
jgi:hypothetical protein